MNGHTLFLFSQHDELGCFFFFFSYVLVLEFTCKFIASVSSCPFLDYNCEIEALSLIMLQGNIAFLRLRNELGRTTVISAAPEEPRLGQQSIMHHDAQKNKSPGSVRTLWFGE